MSPSFELIRRLILVAGEAAFLFTFSRLVFDRVLRATWGRTRLRRIPVTILRAPGNLLHEASHALGYYIGGYRVTRMVPFFFDPEGRGYCRAGRPYAPWAVPWLATGLAAVMPLVVGAAALWGLSRLLGVPQDPEALTRVSADWRLLIDILVGLDYRSLPTWAFLYLALSIGAELAPSDIDLKASLPAIAALTCVLIAVVVAVAEIDALSQFQRPLDVYGGWALSWASSILGFGIMALALVGIPAVILAWPLRKRG